MAEASTSAAPLAVAAVSNSQSGQPALNYPAESLLALSHYTAKDTSKVLVRFKAIGSAPIMKSNSFRITAFNKFQAVVVFLKKALGQEGAAGAREPTLFLYINNSFSPSPDDTVGSLFKSFGTDGHLIVNYSTTPAFG